MANVRKGTFPRKNNTKTWLAVIGISILLVVIGSMITGILLTSKGTESTSDKDSADIIPAAINQPSNGFANGTEADGISSSTIEQPTMAASVPPMGSAGAAAIGGNATGGKAAAAPVAQTSTGSSDSLPPDQLVIRNGTVSLTSQDVDKTILDLRALATEKSGIVFASSSQVRSSGTYANITLQVPSNTFDDVLNRVRQLTGVKVDSENTTSQDVTEEYVDVQAQINNLKATEAQLTTLMNKATDLSDILDLQREITSIRGQIDQRQGRINYLDKHTSMSNLTFTITPPDAPVTVTTKTSDWDAGTALNDAWSGSVRGLQGLYKVLVTVGVWGIWIGPIVLLLVGLLLYLFRRLFPRRAAPAPIATVAATNPPTETENAA